MRTFSGNIYLNLSKVREKTLSFLTGGRRYDKERWVNRNKARGKGGGNAVFRHFSRWIDDRSRKTGGERGLSLSTGSIRGREKE